MTKAFRLPILNSPFAYMPALNGLLVGRSTYTNALRVCWLMVGAKLRTWPCTMAPFAATILTESPILTWLKSLDVTSARHSKRLCRINLKSSTPALATWPTLALRLEMMPSSGAVSLL